MTPAPPFPNQCQGTVTSKKREKRPCPSVATVTVDGRRLCITCARKWTEAAK